MESFTLTTPVAFIIFNRPETTIKVFEQIRLAKPKQLYIIADGARNSRPEEPDRVLAARAIVEQGVDWDCEVITNYAPKNMGCRNRVASGLQWLFEQVEDAIILEDDCVPHSTFFRYCQELLEYYRHDERVGVISGANFRCKREDDRHSYFFSRYHPITGWASWRRVWKYYDLEMKTFPHLRDSGLLAEMIGEPHLVKYWTKIFQSAYEGKETTWDYQLTFAVWTQAMLSVIPNHNQITNIGFGGEATHIAEADHPTANVPVEAMPFPLQHPPYMVREMTFDRYIWDKLLRWTLPYRVKRKLQHLTKR